MDSTTEIQPPVPVVRRNGWLKVLTTAVVFYVLLLVALLLTKNSNLFPTLAMVGSFMVPVAYVAFIYERRHLSSLTMQRSPWLLYMAGFWVSLLRPF